MATRSFGSKTSKHELEQRLAIVEDLMVEGLPSRKIVDELERQKQWARSTVARYIQQVRERWVVERAAERLTETEETLARLTKLAFDLRRAKEWGHLVRTETLLADIRGVRAPDRVDHRVAAIVQHQAAPSVAALEIVDQASEAFLDELERLADRKLAALPAHVDVIEHVE